MGAIVRLGNKFIGVVALIISCVAVAVGFFWIQQESNQQYQEYQQNNQNQMAELLHQFVSSRVDDIKRQMASVAMSSNIISLLEESNVFDIDNQQRKLKSLFPNALKVCLISASVDNVDPNACIPISFATLNSLRKAKKEGLAPIVLMKSGSDEAHVLLAHRIGLDAESAIGVLVVTLKPELTKELLHHSANFQGYIELQQGTKKIAVLDSYGDVSKKQGVASHIQTIPDSYWKTAYWPVGNGNASKSSPLMMVLAMVLTIMVLAWLFVAFFRSSLLKKNVAVLNAQLADFKLGALKPKYPLSFKVLDSLVNEIQVLGKENYHATAKKGATAESISKKVENKSRITLKSLINCVK